MLIHVLSGNGGILWRAFVLAHSSLLLPFVFSDRLAAVPNAEPMDNSGMVSCVCVCVV